MNLTIQINQEPYRVNLEQSYSLAIPLNFAGAQPNHFGVNNATAQVIEEGGFVGDTSRGGSCNVSTITFTPHCNGTHTESVGHIVNELVSVGQLAKDLMLAQLISVTPIRAMETTDSYLPKLENNDWVVTKDDLKRQLESIDLNFNALIVRTLPNKHDKLSSVYGEQHQPPFFTREAMSFIRELGVQHLLVDFPSLDKMYDEGLLTNHHVFWNVEESTHQLTKQVETEKTVTEMIYVPDSISDGLYLLNLNIADFESDAAPSRPVLYALEK